MIARSSSVRWLLAASLAVGSVGFASILPAHAEPGAPPDVQAGAEVQTRGPVHEAFAEVVSFNPEPGPIVPKAPPPRIEEVPPNQRPQGANVAWIPGYWAWDDDRQDFLWISGVWRDMPPGRAWVAGYWSLAGAGSQWTPGFWSNEQAAETAYLPEPPESIEAGPNIAAPSPDTIWTPGCWIWHEGRYAWQPGYWTAGNPDWVWVPAHYLYSPRGYVFCEGYWDHPIEARGVLYAPMYFEPGVYGRAEFRFSPLVAIDLSLLTDHLFVRPTHSHYYFGDYYDTRHYHDGIYAAFSFRAGRFGYDPISVHEHFRHRDDHDWDDRVRRDFLAMRAHEDARPPRTFAMQSAREKDPARFGQRTPVTHTLDHLAENPAHPMHLQAVASSEMQDLVKRGQEVEHFRSERKAMESQGPNRPANNLLGKPIGNPNDDHLRDLNHPASGPAPGGGPDMARLPKSPIVAKMNEQLDPGRGSPKRPDAPRPDPRIDIRPRDPVRARPDQPQPSPRDIQSHKGKRGGG